MLICLLFFAFEDQVTIQSLEFFEKVPPQTVAVAADGSLFVIDACNCRILRFSSEGKPLPPFGQIGQGPGEMTRPQRLDFLDGQLAVHDPPTHHFFRPDGTFLRRGITGFFGVPASGGVFSADLWIVMTANQPPAEIIFTASGEKPEKRVVLTYDRMPASGMGQGRKRWALSCS